MQAVAELVEQRARVVHRQQRRFTGCGVALGEIVVVEDDRARVATVAALPAQAAHPRAAALAGARKVVLQEHTHQRTGRVVHLVADDVGVVHRQVVAAREAQAEQALRAVERRRDHVLELEVRLDDGVVQRIARRTHTLGPEAPVPGLQHNGLARRGHLVGQGLAFDLQRLQRAWPDLVEQALHRLACAGHGVGQRVVGVAGVAMQRGLLAAQAQDVACDFAVVVLARVFTAADPRAPGGFAQVAARAEGQERHHQRPRRRDGMPWQAAFGSRLPCGSAHEVRQAGECRLVGQRDDAVALVVQHVLRKACHQAGQLLHQRGMALARRSFELGARPHAVQVQPFDQAALFSAQPERVALPVHGVQPREQRRVHQHRAAVRGQRRSHRTLHRLQCRAGGRGRQVVEAHRHPVEQPAGLVDGGHRVVEVGRCGLRRNGFDLGTVHAHGLVQRGLEVGRVQQLEGRQAMRGVPVLQQRVGLRCSTWSECVHAGLTCPGGSRLRPLRGSGGWRRSRPRSCGHPRAPCWRRWLRCCGGSSRSSARRSWWRVR